MRILILFASHYGQTRSIAERIADRVRALDHEVDLVNIAKTWRTAPPPEDYDAVAIGSRIEMGRHARSIRDYIRHHVDGLRETPTLFFSVSMAASHHPETPDPEGYLEKLFKEVDWRPTRAVALGGGLPYLKYGWVTRFMLKQISKRAGSTTDTSKNHDFTDWKCVDALAGELATLAQQQGRRAPAAVTQTAT